MHSYNLLFIIIISAIITYLLRLIPYILLSYIDEIPQRLQNIIDRLPPVIMSILVIYCSKSYITMNVKLNIAFIISIIVLGIIHYFKKNTLLSMFVGTVIYMILIRI